MTKTLTVQLKGTLKDAIAEIRAEIEARDDTFDSVTVSEIARRLLAHAVVEHRAGRGPWPKR
jgi:hypothetical protein